MSQPFDASRSLTVLDQDSALIVVIEVSQSSWLVSALVPGVERQPLKKLEPDVGALLKMLHRWRGEATRAGRQINRVVVAYEAGRDGFWLARWLRERDVEAYVIHPSSVAVSREHRRAKTDRLDAEMLMRAFLGWLRGEKRHCTMSASRQWKPRTREGPAVSAKSWSATAPRIVNQMKSTLTRFGIRNFKPTLRKAEEKLDNLQTAEGAPTKLREPDVEHIDRRSMRNGRQKIGPRELHQPLDLALVIALARAAKAIVEQKMADKFGEGLGAPPLAVAEKLRHGDLEIVVENRPRNAAEKGERRHMAVEKSLRRPPHRP
jgi:transposase